MGFSKKARIITLLVIDTVFFFIELFFGYAVGSIALVADSFHMLNDVISLVVALYAIQLATASSSAKYSYGWQRAEILGALINGVFLLALCFSIFMECLQRLVTVPEVTNPQVVVIVGCFGLASNIVGLFLFHDHGHGGGGHSHSHGGPVIKSPSSQAEEPLLGDGGIRRQRKDSLSSLYGHPAQTRASVIVQAETMGYHSHAHGSEHSPLSPAVNGSSEHGARSRSLSKQERAKLEALAEASNNGSEAGHSEHEHDGHAHVTPARSYGAVETAASQAVEAHSHGGHSHDDDDRSSGLSGGGGHGHSHGSMNMQGVFLHVLGDALGNVGVIAAGLVIWLCEGQWRFYSDPLISFIITVIIFSSALPLVKSASFILLQAVPSSIDLDDLRASILDVPGVVSVHELHCWQLSESKVVASVHVLIQRGKDYMATVQGIRKILHDYGIHSSTIQPEFGDEETPIEEAENCLIRCPPDADCAAGQCCTPELSSTAVSGDQIV